MKNIILLFIVIIFLLFFNNISHAIERVLVKTPFCHQPITYMDIRTGGWSPEEIEHSKQVFLYYGGLFKKDEGNFLENNTNLANYEIFCMDIDASNNNNYYLGSSQGIYKGLPNPLQGYLEWDKMSYLGNYQVNCLSINDIAGISVAGTQNNGVFVREDQGEWVQSLSGITINTVLLINSYYYLATSDVLETSGGIYRSTDNGVNWERLTTNSTNTLHYDGSRYLYAGRAAGLDVSEDFADEDDVSWSIKQGTGGWNISAILTSGSQIFVGTKQSPDGFKFYNGTSWSAFNTNLPFNGIYYYTINTLIIDNGYLFLGTDGGGLFKTLLDISGTSVWDPVYVREGSSTKHELKIKQLYSASNNLWVVCHGGDIYSDATSAQNELPPNNPANWGNFLCHTYAWHFTEGGGVGNYLQGPFEYHYVPDPVTLENWDYIQATPADVVDSNWEKVTYGWGHSGIKCLDSTYPSSSPFDPSDIWVTSKWGHLGPLVTHKLLMNPWAHVSPIRYWKSKKDISGTITDNNCVGRQIITSGTTTIPASSIVDFFVAPMLNHVIHLKPGFHAEAGSNFHAYVKFTDPDPPYNNIDCVIPWERCSTFIVKPFVQTNENIEDILNSNLIGRRVESNIQLKLSPNPANNKLTIYPEISGFDNSCLIQIDIYTIEGMLIKSDVVINLVDSYINIEDLDSGTYLLSAKSEIKNNAGKSEMISGNEIFIVNK